MNCTKRRKLKEAAIQHDAGDLTEKQQPKSLFYCCLSFVAMHLDMVESFIDFPDELGRQIFSIAAEHGVFNNSPHLLTLFCDAYEDSVLDSLCLKRCHLALGQRLEYFTMFHNLRRLDLSSCWLGGDHEIYNFFPRLNSLSHLNLSENNLTDEAVQRMTSQIRVYKDGGPRQLVYLDFSGNPDLTVRCARYLAVFKALKFLDLSGARMKSADEATISEKLSLSPCLECGKVTWSNSGWAADVVRRWSDEAGEKQIRPERKDRLDFYKGRTAPLNPIQPNSRSRDSGTQKPRRHVFCSLHRKPQPSTTKNRPSITHSVKDHINDEDLLSQYLVAPDRSQGKSCKTSDIMTQLQSW